MITIRKSQDRGHADHGWLNTYHTFSFADYFDRDHMGFGPLRVINEDRVAPGAGFGAHSHDNMEIISYVLAGALAHKDSMGHVETLRAGELQRMTAGSGVVHSEYNASTTEPVHFLQIWIKPETHGLKPGYEQIELTAETKRGKLALVAAPEGGAMTLHQNARVLIGDVTKGEELNYPIEPGRKAWVQVIRGGANLNGHALTTGDAAAITEEQSIEIRGSAGDNEVLVFDLA